MRRHDAPARGSNGETHRLLTPEDALKGGVELLSPEEKARRERQRISVGYLCNQDVCVYDLDTGKAHAVTTCETEIVAFGLAEFVAQEKFALSSGYWFSPNSRFVAYQETDVSKKACEKRFFW